MQFNTKAFNQFREDCNKALAPLAASYHLEIKAGHISYADNTFTVKVECKKTDAGDLDKLEFEKYREMYGFASEDYQREFVERKERYRLVGFAPSSYKYPIVCQKIADGKRYKFTLDAVKQAMKK